MTCHKISFRNSSGLPSVVAIESSAVSLPFSILSLQGEDSCVDSEECGQREIENGESHSDCQPHKAADQ